ncbi:MAG TPA: protein kinase, partial [Rubrivivax sp.]|nr:protein kinase [Rubrivivax sp.]
MEAPGPHSQAPSALPPGTRLGEFELLSVLGVGGFGIVYLAFDHALEREVAVKEYMPSSLAGRTETMHVSLRAQTDAETFALGLRSFVNEARLLARFDHPSLLKVHRFWEANGTAYMAMPVMRGRTLKEIRLEMVGPPDEAWLRALLDPLLGAIEKLHSEGVFHRDIAPDNIQIEPDGRPVLLDFGAARRVLGDKSQSLTAILKPAYAPIEQYAEAGSVKQGPWTDIYALGATLHFLLLTRPPPPATTRAVHDEASMLIPQILPRCSAGFLNVIDWMLAPRPSDRPQSVAMLRDVLEGRVPPPVRRELAPAVSQWERTVMVGPPPTGDSTMRMPPPAAPRASGSASTPDAAAEPAKQGAGSSPAPATASAKVAAPTPATPRLTSDRQHSSPRAEVASPAGVTTAPSSRLLAIGLAAAVLLMLALVAVLSPRRASEPTVLTQSAVTAPVAVAAPSSPHAPGPSPSVAESQVSNATAHSGPPPTPPVFTTPVAPAVGVGPVVATPVTQAEMQQPAMQPVPARAEESTPPAGTGPLTNGQGARPLPLPQRPQPINSGGAQGPTAPLVAPPNAAAPAPRSNAE